MAWAAARGMGRFPPMCIPFLPTLSRTIHQPMLPFKPHWPASPMGLRLARTGAGGFKPAYARNPPSVATGSQPNAISSIASCWPGRKEVVGQFETKIRPFFLTKNSALPSLIMRPLDGARVSGHPPNTRACLMARGSSPSLGEYAEPPQLRCSGRNGPAILPGCSFPTQGGMSCYGPCGRSDSCCFFLPRAAVVVAATVRRTDHPLYL